jgi:hypothetical protein
MFRIVMMDLALEKDIISHITEAVPLFDCVECRFYGDDNIVAVPDGMDWFNMLTVRYKMEEIFGMEYTTADKQEVAKPYYSIDEISYLKRTFHFVNDKVQMRLDMDSICEIPLWSPGVLTPILAQSMIDSMTGELSLYPVDDYNTIIRPLLRAWEEYGVVDPGYRSTRLFVDYDYNLVLQSGEVKTTKKQTNLGTVNRASQGFVMSLVSHDYSCKEKQYEPLWVSALAKEEMRTQKNTMKNTDSDVSNITHIFELQSGYEEDVHNQTVFPENSALLGEEQKTSSEQGVTKMSTRMILVELVSCFSLKRC